MLGTAIGGASAVASLPSPMWFGVEKVIINCRFDGSVQPAALRESLCGQIVSEAARLTAYPVSRAGGYQTQNPALNPQTSKELILHVDARLASGIGPASALVMSVRPERIGLRAWRGAESRPARVELKWRGGMAELQGPIAPLSFILSEPGRRSERPPFPVRSDEQ